MPHELTVLETVIAAAPKPPSEAEQKGIAYYLRRAKADNTRRTYWSNVRDFVR